MKIRFTKTHGSGNDFVLVDAITNGYDLSEEEYLEFTRSICDRGGEVGGDGTLFLLPSETADARMRMFNIDGSEAEMCGNGIRIIGRQAAKVLGRKEFSIETMKAPLAMQKERSIACGVEAFSVNIDNVSQSIIELPMTMPNTKTLIDTVIPELHPTLRFTAFSLGNPHLVAIVDEMDFDLLKELGEKGNNLKSLLPRGVNLSFIKILEDQAIFVSTYERGVGLTDSCGTAMSSCSMASCLLGYNTFGEWIKVYNKGGMVKCRPEFENGKLNVHLLGNATYEWDATADFDQKSHSIVSTIRTNVYDETIAWDKFGETCKNFARSKGIKF